MAQSAVSSMPNGTTTGMTEEQLELEEYEKIVRFRNVVFSGTHPRIKLPAHMAPQPLSTTKPIPTGPKPQMTVSEPAAPVATVIPTVNMDRVAKGLIPEDGAQNAADRAGRSIPAGGSTNNPDINPIFLEKGPALIKAEMKIKRDKIERALKEQVEQQRKAAQAATQPGVEDEIPDFDVNEVLAKALAIARAKPLVGEKKPATGAEGAPSDSFDDNTFYSSIPPESTSSGARRESGEMSSRSIFPLQPAIAANPLATSANPSQSKQVAIAPVSTSVVPGLQELARAQPPSAHVSHNQQTSLPVRPPSGPSNRQQQNQNSRENFYNNDLRNDQGVLPPNAQQGVSDLVNTSSTGGPAIRQDNTLPTRMEIDPAPPAREPVNQGTKPPANAIPPRPLSVEEPEDIRNFNLSPVAPQPVRVSPLATAKGPAFAQQNFELDGSQTYTPLQGRQDGTTTGGSSGQDKQPQTHKGKRKHCDGKTGSRNNGAAPSRPDSPYIKPEPRSPSPFNPAPLPRPHKRQRQAPQDNGGLDYDEPTQEDARPPQSRQPRPRQGNSRRFPRQQRDGPEVVEIDELHFRQPQHPRIISQDMHPIPPSPRTHVVPFPPYEQRVERIARPVSRMVIDPYAPSAPYQPTPAPRSARPVEVIRDGSVSPAFRQIDSPVMMAPPPRVAERRLVIDDYGRQYYASIPVVPRQSMVPQSRVIDQDYIFDRPARTMTRPVQHVYEEDGVFYNREPTYAPQRRVISMQDDQVEPSSYRQREVSVRPLPLRQGEEQGEAEPVQVVRPREITRRPSVVARAPVDDYVRIGEEYVRVMPPPQRREMSHFEQQPQIVRMGSVRPEQRYGAPLREYVTARAPSIHPDGPVPVRREFAASVRPEEMVGEPIVQTRERAYSVRPADGMMPPRREYQPAEVYQQPIRRVVRRGDEDVEYVSYQQPMRQVARRPEENIRYAPRGGFLGQDDEYDAQPQYQPRKQVQQEVYEDGPQQVVYR